MEARGYGLKGRTSFHLFKFSRRDIAMLILMAVTASPVFYGAYLGVTNMYFYPKLVLPQLDLTTALILISYAILSAAPMIVDIIGEYKWKQLDLNM